MKISEFKESIYKTSSGIAKLGSKGVVKQKAADNVIEQGAHVLAPARSRGQKLWLFGSGFIDKRRLRLPGQLMLFSWS